MLFGYQLWVLFKGVGVKIARSAALKPFYKLAEGFFYLALFFPMEIGVRLKTLRFVMFGGGKFKRKVFRLKTDIILEKNTYLYY